LFKIIETLYGEGDRIPCQWALIQGLEDDIGIHFAQSKLPKISS